MAALTVFIPADGKYAVLLGEKTNLGQTPANVGGAGYEYTLAIKGVTYAPVAIAALPHAKAYAMAVDAPDFYSFTDEQQELLQIETIASRLATPSPIDTYLTVWDAAAKQVVAANDNLDASGTVFDSLLRVTAVAGKEYILVVESVFYASQATDYDLSLAPLAKDKETEPNDGPDLAIPMNFPGQIDGFIDAPKDAIDPWTGDTMQVPDVDYYAFTAKKGDLVTFGFRSREDSSVDATHTSRLSRSSTAARARSCTTTTRPA